MDNNEVSSATSEKLITKEKIGVSDESESQNGVQKESRVRNALLLGSKDAEALQKEEREIDQLVQQLTADDMDPQVKMLVEFVNKMKTSIQCSHDELLWKIGTMMENSDQATNKDLNEVKKDQEKLVSEVNFLKAENRLMKGVMVKQHQIMDEYNDRLMKLEMKSKQDMITISNIDETYNEDSIGLVELFFKQVLRINVTVKDAYRSGNRTPKQLTVTLKDKADKGKIFKNVSKLKNFRTKSDKKGLH